MERLSAARAMIVGLGGVGGYALEAVARCGVGFLFLADFDRVSESNINRQILADSETIGLLKTEVAAHRVKKINEDVKITLHSERVTAETAAALLSRWHPDLLIDAVDDVHAKVALAVAARELGVPMIMSLGTGNRQDPAALRITDLAKTSGCPLGRAVRHDLRVKGITHLPVLFSNEPPCPSQRPEIPIGSLSFVPSVAGLMMASFAVRLLCDESGRGNIC